MNKKPADQPRREGSVWLLKPDIEGEPAGQPESDRWKDWEGEVCDDCEKPYATAYRVPDEVWAEIHKSSPAGLLCIDCADKRAEERDIYLWWEGEPNEFPTAALLKQVESLTKERAELNQTFDHLEIELRAQVESLEEELREKNISIADLNIKTTELRLRIPDLLP